jgi:hypothetical protein
VVFETDGAEIGVRFRIYCHVISRGQSLVLGDYSKSKEENRRVVLALFSCLSILKSYQTTSHVKIST